MYHASGGTYITSSLPFIVAGMTRPPRRRCEIVRIATSAPHNCGSPVHVDYSIQCFTPTAAWSQVDLMIPPRLRFSSSCFSVGQVLSLIGFRCDLRIYLVPPHAPRQPYPIRIFGALIFCFSTPSSSSIFSCAYRVPQRSTVTKSTHREYAHACVHARVLVSGGISSGKVLRCVRFGCASRWFSAYAESSTGVVTLTSPSPVWRRQSGRRRGVSFPRYLYLDSR